jgi:hypothetical protein
MTQTMDLSKMGLAPMTEFEMTEIDGGFWKELVEFIAGVVAGYRTAVQQ